MTTASANAEDSLRHNGKTFHWARRFLGDAMGASAAQLYAYCRILDDMADGDIPNGPERLKAAHQALTARKPLQDDDLAELMSFMDHHQISPDIMLALIDGLLMDQKTVALVTQDDVVRYSYHVAGTVGVMMCSILNAEPARIHDAYYHAIDMGIGMQLTNIARDVLEDAAMGRRYLPGDWIGGMSAADIVAAAENNDPDGITTVRSGIQRLLGVAETYYQSGIIGLNDLPLRAHLAILIAGQSYRQIGIQLARRGTNWHQGRTVTTTLTKALASIAAMPKMSQRVSLGLISSGRIGSMPPHQSYLHQALKGLPHVHSA